MLVHPTNSLRESLLLGVLLSFDALVALHCESMRDTREQVDLPGLACLNEDLLRLVSLLRREDRIYLGCRNGEGTSDGSKLLIFNK
jgi:hypothetical protein